MLYTIVITYKEDDFVIQTDANSPSEAIHISVISDNTNGIRLFNDSEFQELKELVKTECDLESCVPVNLLKHVWCDTFLVNDQLVQMHVVLTSECFKEN